MKKRLEALLSHLDDAPVECDGFSSLAATLLSRNGIAFQGMCGQIIAAQLGSAIPHVWIEVGGLVVDYRARMWMGNGPDVPHGVFRKADHPDLYKGNPVEIEPLPDFLFKILQTPFPTNLNESGSGLEP